MAVSRSHLASSAARWARSRVIARRLGRSGRRVRVIRALLSASEPSLAWKVTRVSAARRDSSVALAVGCVEKRGIGEPRPHDPLVAGADLGRIAAFDVGDGDEDAAAGCRPCARTGKYRWWSCMVAISTSGGSSQEALLEVTGERHRPFDQGRHLVEQRRAR